LALRARALAERLGVEAREAGVSGVDCFVIGAGVVGLAVARAGREVVVVAVEAED
jgi:hypothetical protein